MMWWIIGALFILIPAQDYWVKWRAGASYRTLKKTHGTDPFVRPILKLTAHHFHPKPFHFAFPAIGLFILACETMDVIQ
tara:strand:+ start:112 stop:348 length:237 start_codon:yes stop_codon:yes gene_type:complete